MEDKDELKNLVLQKEKEGKVVLMTTDALIEIDLENFIKQPTEGLLYDLNRDKVTVLTLMDEKWVNDYAVGLVIAKLKEYYDNAKQPTVEPDKRCELTKCCFADNDI